MFLLKYYSLYSQGDQTKQHVMGREYSKREGWKAHFTKLQSQNLSGQQNHAEDLEVEGGYQKILNTRKYDVEV